MVDKLRCEGRDSSIYVYIYIYYIYIYISLNHYFSIKLTQWFTSSWLVLRPTSKLFLHFPCGSSSKKKTHIRTQKPMPHIASWRPKPTVRSKRPNPSSFFRGARPSDAGLLASEVSRITELLGDVLTSGGELPLKLQLRQRPGGTSDAERRCRTARRGRECVVVEGRGG